MPTISEIPSVDVPPEGAFQRRQIEFHKSPRDRRSFMRVVAAGGMALGMTALSWIPSTRRATATVGTFWPRSDCADSGYDYNPCGPFPYGEKWCGTDGWFKNFGARGADGNWYTYTPLRICGPSPQRNAWYWYYPTSGWTIRCADGRVSVTVGTPPNHTVTHHYRICSKGVRRGR
jgi:hypothetical protein